ncbi:MAG: nucleotidyltransferase domain-containing protein [Asgard group archaeon]|nr:nucleotidyltransferase domain-containing protein [Asgard group archaeon]
MNEKKNVKKRFDEALETFVDFIKEDKNIITAVLFGSLIEGNVWEKSDVDIFLISNDEKVPYRFYWLDQDDLNFQVSVYSRNNFKRQFERSLTGSWFQHMINTSKILFSKDETISEYIQQAQSPGKRDVELQILTIVAMVIGDLEKAEKFLIMKNDVAQSYLFIVRLLDRLAQIEVLLNGEVPKREVLEQAMKYKSELFDTIFTSVILETTNKVKMEDIIRLIRTYLEERTESIFSIIIDYFREEQEVRSITDITTHLNKMMQSSWWEVATLAYCQWLHQYGYLERFAQPARLTSKSFIQVNEIAYTYTGGDE